MAEPQVPRRCRGIDLSAWQESPSLEWWGRLRADDYYVAITQLWGYVPPGQLGPNPYAEDHLYKALLAKFPILGGYIVIPPDDTTETHILIQTAKAAAGKMAEWLRLVALDIEPGGLIHPTDPLGRILDALRNTALAFPHAIVAVYTSEYMWHKALGPYLSWDPALMPPPLWEARWVYQSGRAPAEPPDIDWAWSPFGPWTQRAGLQYAASVPIRDVRVDLDIFDLERLGVISKVTPPRTRTIHQILSRLEALEQRVARLEAHVYRE